MNEILIKLKKSKFRSSFKLSDNDKKYIEDKGIEKIKEHAYDFVKNRLASNNLKNDGKQTPMHGHPVFVAQHATATCCRGCLYKWHHIPKGIELNQKQQQYIVALIMEWIQREVNTHDLK